MFLSRIRIRTVFYTTRKYGEPHIKIRFPLCMQKPDIECLRHPPKLRPTQVHSYFVDGTEIYELPERHIGGTYCPCKPRVWTSDGGYWVYVEHKT